MIQVCYLVDGFNLYHSVSDAALNLKATTKWLDIKKLCESYLPSQVGKGAVLKDIYYFSALAKFRERVDPGVTQRHKQFLKCLKDTGVIIELNRFKEKIVICSKCHKSFVKHEEKETDVSIALKLFEIFMLNICDVAILVTGDTDLAPAVKSAQRLFPEKKVFYAFPYKRKNRELSKIAPRSFKIRTKQYIKFQFPNPYTLVDGTEIYKPSSW